MKVEQREMMNVIEEICLDVLQTKTLDRPHRWKYSSKTYETSNFFNCKNLNFQKTKNNELN